MYPRLRLARNLLKNDGILLISIDDNEVQNLRKLCDEIYGEENFVSTFIWKSRQNKDNRTLTGVSTDHEYVMCYVKDNSKRRIKGSKRKTEQYSNPDNDPRGVWVSANMVGLKDANSRPNLHYDLIDPETAINYGRPKMGWRYDSTTMNRLISEKRIIWPSSTEGRPRRKVFLSEIDENLPGYSSIIGANIFTRDGTSEIDELFNNRIFDFPKPTELIKELIEQCCEDNDIVLDFFAGSGTTAQAVMQLNSEENINIRFFCIQLPEPLYEEGEAFRNGYRTISDISKERIRRAGEKVKTEFKENLFLARNKPLDVGFRVFKMDSSNINAWDGSVKDFEQNLLSATENIKPDRMEEDVLYEILLKSGLDLSQSIEEKTIANKKVFNIGLGALFICLANELTTVVAEGIGKWKQELDPATCKVIFKDTGFNDVEKTNSFQILKRYGINEVNTL
jgi:adenine-specific DNA-methyltransferase